MRLLMGKIEDATMGLSMLKKRNRNKVKVVAAYEEGWPQENVLSKREAPVAEETKILVTTREIRSYHVRRLVFTTTL
ncbi:hypothetical protein M5689_002969 [Euphorbia peplus]|nr:hypothetical protein M5689_002969 [Euphorbia peplus]